MNDTIRAFLSICAGVTIGLVLIKIGYVFSPWQPPAGMDYYDAAAYSAWLRTLPDTAFGFLLAVFAIACFAGGFLTNRLAPAMSFPPSFITGFTLLFYNIVTLLAFPNPFWMSVASCTGCVVFALLGGWVATRMK